MKVAKYCSLWGHQLCNKVKKAVYKHLAESNKCSAVNKYATQSTENSAVTRHLAESEKSNTVNKFILRSSLKIANQDSSFNKETLPTCLRATKRN